MSDADVDFFTPLAKQKQTVMPKATVKSAAPSEPITSNKDYESIITPDLLDKIRHVESRGKPYAINPTSKAMGPYQFMPDQIVTMHKQGIKFNPLDEAEARNAATIYLKQLANRNKGDINKVLAQYGGFVTKDPSGYINDVMNAKAVKEEHPDVSFFKPLAKPEPVVEKPIEDKAAFGIYPRMAGSRQTIEARQPPSFKDIPAEAAAIGDIVAGAPAAILGTAGYGALRLAGRTPEQAQQTAQSTAGLIANPIGKLTGTEQTPAYQQSQFTAPLRQLGTGIHNASEQLGKSYGVAPQDVQFAMESGLMLAPKIVQGMGKVGGAVQDVRSQMAQQLAAKQAQAPQPVNPQFQSGGAAAVEHANAISEALARNPELQAKYQNVPPESFTPQDLTAIDTHNKFAKFNMTPTEGQALRDTNLMSQEMNARLKDPELNARIQERDPKLIQGFQQVREAIAPDVYETNPVQLANAPLEKMKADMLNHEQRIRDAFDKANNATGTGESPIDVGELQNNIANALKKKQRTSYVPKELKDDLNEALSKGHLTAEEYENFRTDTATIARTNKDPMARQAAYIIREQLENVPLQGQFAQYKPLFDEARNLTKQLKEKEKIPAYRAAGSDTRTPEQIDSGVPHSAANTFLDKHFGEKTPQSDIDKMLSIIGKDSPEHQALMAARLDAIKKNSGIVNNEGVVQQKALNKQVFEQYKGNGNAMFGPEKYKELQDLAEVANLSEHVKGRHSVNVSNTELLAEQNRIKDAAKEVAGGLAAGKADLAIQSGTGIPMVGTLTRMFLKKKAEQQAAEQALAAERALAAKRTSPTAGISVAPPRIELRNMAPGRPD
jgi:protein-tyrosine-phosphatase